MILHAVSIILAAGLEGPGPGPWPKIGAGSGPGPRPWARPHGPMGNLGPMDPMEFK